MSLLEKLEKGILYIGLPLFMAYNVPSVNHGVKKFLLDNSGHSKKAVSYSEDGESSISSYGFDDNKNGTIDRIEILCSPEKGGPTYRISLSRQPPRDPNTHFNSRSRVDQERAMFNHFLRGLEER